MRRHEVIQMVSLHLRLLLGHWLLLLPPIVRVAGGLLLLLGWVTSLVSD